MLISSELNLTVLHSLCSLPTRQRCSFSRLELMHNGGRASGTFDKKGQYLTSAVADFFNLFGLFVN